MTTWFGNDDQQAIQLRQAYEARCSLFFIQPLPVKQFFIAQSQILADACLTGTSQVHFQLPEQVVSAAGRAAPLPVPEEKRFQKAGSRFHHFRRESFLASVSQLLSRLEESPDRAVAIAAALTRLTTVLYMVQGMLPEIGSVPSAALVDPAEVSLCTIEGKAENCGDNQPDLENSLQRAAAILAVAVQLAPYIRADEGYRQKCKQVLSSLVQKGQAAALNQTAEIIERLKRKAVANELDRGLSLSLPYFDDRQMEPCLYELQVIPVGRIPFDPRYVRMAARAERGKIAAAGQFSTMTRRHLLAELRMLETAFREAG